MRFPPAADPPELTFTCQLQPPLAINWTTVEPLYISPNETQEGLKQFFVYSAENCILLRFTDIADFYLWSDLIICHLVNPAHEFMVEICFLGTVLACWFELQGIVALHAAASVIEGQAVAFLSSNMGGKSSLATALMRLGFPLLTDDILLVEWENGRLVGRSGYPQMRMWPEQAAYFFGKDKEFSQIHPYLGKRRVPINFERPGQFQSGRFPLVCCYIPERHKSENNGSEVKILPISPVEGVLKLAGYSFLNWLLEPMGLQPRRLKTLSQAVQSAAVHRLLYPNGVEHLTAVAEAIIADVKQLA